MVRILALLLGGFVLAGCSTASESVATADRVLETDVRAAGVSTPLGGVAVGVGVVQLTVPPETEIFLGTWSLARDGDRGCRVDLGSSNAIGDLTAKTRGCTSIELARIALWQPDGDGVVLYDFERRPVVNLRKAGNAIYEGPMWDGVRVTLWR